MPARRSRGQPVDYRALDGADSDDDFSTATPPTKRPRAKKGSDREAEFADGAGPSGVRASLDDKLFKKQLKIALEKSRTESQSTATASSQEQSAADASSQEHSIKSADTLPVSQIDELESLKKVQSASQDVSSQDPDENEDEWAADGNSDSDESENSGDDSSFSDEEFKPKAKKPTAKAAKLPKAKPAKQTTPKARANSVAKRRASPATRKESPSVRRSWVDGTEKGASPATSPAAAPSRPVLKALNSTALAAASSPALTAPTAEKRAGTTKWKPPARVSEAPASEKRLLSPPAGGLRLGLSRNVRLKPLHPAARPVT